MAHWSHKSRLPPALAASPRPAVPSQMGAIGRRVGTAVPRRSASGHGYDTNYASQVEAPRSAKIYEHLGTALGATMWFWVLWRAKHDLPHLLGFEHPWDHMDDHGHGHGEAEAEAAH